VTVRAVKGGYKVAHCSSGKKGYLSKKPKTKKAAQRQHRAVMASKRKRKK
jgi:hypothetical protein